MPKHPDIGSHPAFDYMDHRPWPLPEGRWVGRQSWRDLLFAHWPVPVAAVRLLVPAGLTVQEFDGASWLGIVPFRMAGVMARGLPDLPWISAFPELNVRVYVERDGKPGVWFLSLDATNSLAVWGARTFFHLPYYWADIDVTRDGDDIFYRSERRGSRNRVSERNSVSRVAAAVFAARYRPTSAVYAAAPGTLEHWLTERYCLYAAARDGTLYRTEVHHRQWLLQRAEVEVGENTISAAGGLPVSGSPALLHFARRLDVVVWRSERIKT
jgi:uncharacterized protein YqjF (DUF2071 family)